MRTIGLGLSHVQRFWCYPRISQPDHIFSDKTYLQVLDVLNSFSLLLGLQIRIHQYLFLDCFLLHQVRHHLLHQVYLQGLPHHLLMLGLGSYQLIWLRHSLALFVFSSHISWHYGWIPTPFLANLNIKWACHQILHETRKATGQVPHHLDLTHLSSSPFALVFPCFWTFIWNHTRTSWVLHLL